MSPTSLSALVARAAVGDNADELVQTVLKPRVLAKEPDREFNFIVDMVTRWRGSSLTFIAIYEVGSHSSHPGDTFEAPFARMTYNEKRNSFSLSFMRHTGRWQEVYPALSADECLESIRDDPWFIVG